MLALINLAAKKGFCISQHGMQVPVARGKMDLSISKNITYKHTLILEAYGIGTKEVWTIIERKHRLGLVTHTPLVSH